MVPWTGGQSDGPLARRGADGTRPPSPDRAWLWRALAAGGTRGGCDGCGHRVDGSPLAATALAGGSNGRPPAGHQPSTVAGARAAGTAAAAAAAAVAPVTAAASVTRGGGSAVDGGGGGGTRRVAAAAATAAAAVGGDGGPGGGVPPPSAGAPRARRRPSAAAAARGTGGPMPTRPRRHRDGRRHRGRGGGAARHQTPLCWGIFAYLHLCTSAPLRGAARCLALPRRWRAAAARRACATPALHNGENPSIPDESHP
ncbi:hypothetical protein BU14_0134s0020 [Porphyra umbilicalis]|uniref:Uncharacterized protein n=1 Tax=Porphyra umbilicalis TaxID=2786 RepID=A0A1X6PA62_PORUM|nr:hypothetical protein BU14_0134s0020 [Porphyra umbilicalis]|eukprot:OSX77799.1 hypothetical protein BU14_0134s0020 [Porphyra umbilicalis]